MTCDGTGIIHTIGHSTRAREVFADLLRTHNIQLLVDVRRWPMSRRHPHFNRDALAGYLKTIGIEYLWRQDLGGFRKPAVDSVNTAWKVGAFRAYADFMLTMEFAHIMSDLEPIAAKQRAALMCAEALPWRCHRQLLADAYLVRGWQVRHILDNGCSSHKLPPFAQLHGVKIIYNGLL